MLIDKDIASNQWRIAAEEQLKRTYKALGYRVRSHAKIGDFEADLVARKGRDLIVFEIKSKNHDSVIKRKNSEFRDYVVDVLGGKFKIIYVSPPREISVEINMLPDVLMGLLQIDSKGLDALATHVLIDEIDGVEIDSVAVSAEGIRVVGSATAYIELQYGSGSDFRRGDGARMSDSYPFDFDVLLNCDMEVLVVNHLDVDTSSFYE